MSIEVVAIWGSLLILLLCLLIIVFVFEFRRRQNSYYKEKELMNAQFEQTLLRSQIEVQEATFSTLGKELHDNIGQLLSTAKMMISITQQSLPDAPIALHTAYEMLAKAIVELRLISKSMNKEWLEQFSLVDNLTAEAEHINSGNTIKVHLSHPDNFLLSTDKQIILFRIIQEGIQNAIKHANPANIFIDIQSQNSFLLILIKDDGCGFSVGNTNNGVGILNMKQRVKMLGGKIDWLSNGEGCTVTISLPVL